MFWVVNLITFSRFVVAYFVFYNLKAGILWLAILWFFFGAGTDYLDGRLAERFKVKTEVGKMLDATADKVLILAVVLNPMFFYIVPPAQILVVLTGLIALREISICVWILGMFAIKACQRGMGEVRKLTVAGGQQDDVNTAPTDEGKENMWWVCGSIGILLVLQSITPYGTGHAAWMWVFASILYAFSCIQGIVIGLDYLCKAVPWFGKRIGKSIRTILPFLMAMYWWKKIQSGQLWRS